MLLKLRRRIYSSNNKLWVKTLDLDLPFSEISEQLNKIADEYFFAA